MRWRGFLSIVMLWLTFAALHDITLDNAQSFPAGYRMLAVSAAWFVTMALYLGVRRHRVAAITSLVLTALGVMACWDLPHHGAPPSMFNYLVWVPMFWFLGLAIWMLVAPRRTPASVSAV